MVPSASGTKSETNVHQGGGTNEIPRTDKGPPGHCSHLPSQWNSPSYSYAAHKRSENNLLTFGFKGPENALVSQTSHLEVPSAQDSGASSQLFLTALICSPGTMEYLSEGFCRGMDEGGWIFYPLQRLEINEAMS